VRADAALFLHKIQNTIPNGHRLETKAHRKEEGYRINQKSQKNKLGSGQEFASREEATIACPHHREVLRKTLLLTGGAIPDNIAGSTFRKDPRKQ
jgi:hypothetical protein